LSFASLETTGKSKTLEHKPEVNVNLIQSDPEIAFDEWDIEAPAVIGDNEFKPLNIPHKIIQVLAIDIGMNRLTIIKRDGCNLITPIFQTGGLNVNISDNIPEVRE
jgi:hypothetical protein